MSDWKFKLLYDGECPLCLQEVRMLQRWNRQGSLAFEDISSPEVDLAKYGTTREELRGVIHGVFPDGRVVRKVEVSSSLRGGGSGLASGSDRVTGFETGF